MVHDDTFATGGVGLVGWSEQGADSLRFTQLDVVEHAQRSVPARSECTLTLDDSAHPGTRQVRLGPLGADGTARVLIEPGDESILFIARTANRFEVINLSAATDPFGTELYNRNYDGIQNDRAQPLQPALPSDEGELTLFLPLAPAQARRPVLTISASQRRGRADLRCTGDCAH